MNAQQTEQYFLENPDKLREVIILFINGISSDWMAFKQNDPRPRLLLRYLYLYDIVRPPALNPYRQRIYERQFEVLLSQISMYIAGWQGDIIQVPEFLKS